MARQNQTVRIDIEASGIEKFERQVEQLYQRLQRRSREAGMSQREMGGYIDRALRNQDELAQRDLINQKDNLRRSIDEGRMSRTKASQLWDQARRTYETETAVRREVRKRNERDTDRRREEREYRLDEMTRSSWRDVRTKARNWQGVDSQINAIERARAAEIKREESRIDKAEKKGEITSKEAERLRKENRDDAQFNREMLQKLREIAQNTKDSARKSGEELAKRLNIQDKEQADRAIQSLMRPTGDVAKDSRRRAAADVIREQYPTKQVQDDDINLGGMLGSLASGDMGGLLRGAGAALKIAGPLALLAGIGTNLFRNYQGRWERARDVAIVSGRTVKQVSGDVGKGRGLFSQLGFDDEEIYQVMGSQQQSAGRSLYTRDVLQGIIRGRLFNVDSNRYNELLRLGRYSSGDAIGVAGRAASMAKSRWGSPLRSDEILDVYQQMAQRELSVTGRVNAEANLGTISTIMNTSGAQGQQLGRIVNALQNIGQTSSPTGKALLQKAAAEFLGPDASMWDIQKLIENPMSNPEFLNSYMRMVERAGGGKDATKFALRSLTGLSYDDTEKLYASMRSGRVAGTVGASSSVKEDEKYVEEYNKYVGTREKLSGWGSAVAANVSDATAAAIEATINTLQRESNVTEQQIKAGTDQLLKGKDFSDKMDGLWKNIQGTIRAVGSGASMGTLRSATADEILYNQ